MSEAAFDELIEHWREEPPIAVCVRAYLGIKPSAKAEQAPRKALSVAEWEQLKRAAQADEAMNGRAS